MEELVKKYLIENKTIIIPRLGALTLTNEVTLEVMFLSYLKFDDGKLIEAYANSNNGTLEEAKDSVYKWVDKIVSDLDNDLEVTMSDIGIFFKNNEGEYDFRSGTTVKDSSDLKEHENLEAEKDTITENVIIAPPVEEVAYEPEKVEESGEENDFVESEKEEVQEIEPETILQESIVETTVEESKSEPVLMETETISQDKSDITLEKEEKIIPPENPSIQQNEAIIERKRRSPINKILIALTIVLLLLGTASVVFYEDLRPFLPFTKNEKFTKVEVKKPVIPEDDLAEEPEDVNLIEEETNTDAIEENGREAEKVEVKEKIIETPKIVSDSKVTHSESGFYVIVGSFSNRSNADNLLNDLISKGYKSEIVEGSGLNMVSIARFSTFQEAQTMNTEVENSWILKK